MNAECPTCNGLVEQRTPWGVSLNRTYKYNGRDSIFRYRGHRQDLGSPKGPSGEQIPRALQVKKRIYSSRFLLPDPTKASFGARLRYLRRRLGLTIEQFSKTTGPAAPIPGTPSAAG